MAAGRVTTTTGAGCVVSRGGCTVVASGGSTKSSVIMGCRCVVCSTVWVGMVTDAGGNRVVPGSLSNGCAVCEGVAPPSSMVTTMCGADVVVAGDSYSTCVADIIVVVSGRAGGGCSVVKRPALVRCVVISTSAGYSVKNGAAVVDTSVHKCRVEVSSCSSDAGGGGGVGGVCSALVVVYGGK